MDYAIKYRPKQLEDVIGQEAVCKSLEAKLKKDELGHVLLFHGPSGTGKTTLARIVARRLKVASSEIYEYDAATNTGIDAWRDIMRQLRFLPMNGKRKALIVDEAHALSTPAWTSLLKSVEEPPDHVYWMFCTTHYSKVPANIRSRCVELALRDVVPEKLQALVLRVATAEGKKIKDEILDLVISAADGSPRKAITAYQAVSETSSPKDAQAILQRAPDEKEIIELTRELVKGSLTWARAMKVISQVPQPNPEGWRLQIRAYITTVVAKMTKDQQVVQLLNILEAFNRPCNPGKDGMSDFYIALGKCFYESGE